MKKGCFNCFLLLIFVQYTFAQKNLLFKTFSFDQGLNTYNIYKTRQDKYGFIWISTQDGLYRFNGKSFEVIKNNIGSSNTTMGNVFSDMEIGSDDRIYAADYYYGIDVINAANWQVKYIGGNKAREKKVLPNYWVEKLYIDTKLNLWVGGNGYIAFKRNKDKEFISLTELPGLHEEIRVTFIKQVTADIVAIGVNNYGILFYNINSLRQCGSVKPGSPLFNIQAVNDICLKGDTIFAVTNSTIIKGVMVDKNWKTISQYSPANLKNLLTTCVVHDDNDGLWIGTNSGIVYFNTVSQQAFTYKADKIKSNWLKDNFINGLMIDNQQNLWISTFNVLQMTSLGNNQFTAYSGERGSDDYMEHIYTIAAKNNTEVFCTGINGLYTTNIITRKTRRIPGSHTLGLIHHIEKITEDFWIIATDKGMYGYEPVKDLISQQSLLQKFPEWKLCRNNYFNTAFRNGNVFYWASEEREGLVKWDMKNHTLVKFKMGTGNSAGLIENHIRNIKTDKNGFLWILSDATVSRFNMQKDTVVEVLYFNNDKNTPNASIYFDMYDDGKILWFASYGAGVCGYDRQQKKWEFITEREGLCNNSVYSILPESDSIFWVSTNMGLSRVNHYTKNCSNYFDEDGLQDNSFDEKGALALGNRLLFGGINGFTLVDLKKVQSSSYNFPVYIHKLEYYAANKKYSIQSLSWGDMELPTGTNNIEIFLSALTYTDNHKIKFRYKIKGLHDDYVDAGTNNSISLNTLGYGHYTIFIQYRKPDGTYINDALQINLFIHPKWYQTWWFKLLIFLVTVGIIYAFYRYRIAQIKKQQEIRKNIATDLHDDLGSTLNSVKVFANLAIEGIRPEESLLQVKSNLNEATSGLRDMIWVLDDSLDTVNELVTRLTQYALPVAAASNIQAAIKADSEVNGRQLTKEEKRNLFLVCKEAINNSIKYSGASQIQVAITASGKKIRILVTDDGKGFTVEEVQKGYGLKNMQYRAGQVKYKVVLQSSPGTGTRISIEPL